MQNLTSEEQAKLDLMEIAGFKVFIQNGLFCVESHKYFPRRMVGVEDENVKTFDSIDGVMGFFEYWKKRNGKS